MGCPDAYYIQHLSINISIFQKTCVELFLCVSSIKNIYKEKVQEKNIKNLKKVLTKLTKQYIM